MSAYLPYKPRLRTLLTVSDGLGLALAAWVAFLVRFPPGLRAAKWQQLLESPGLMGWALASAWLLAVACELYEPESLHRRREVVIRTLVMVGSWSAALALATYAWPAWAYGRGLLALTAAASAPLLILTRWAVAAWLRRRPKFPALVVGEPGAVQRFCQELASRPSAPWRPIDGSLLTPDAVSSRIADTGASMVVLAAGDERALEMGPTLTALHFSGVPVAAASELWAWLEERLPLEALSSAIFLHQPGFGAVHWTLFNRLTRIADIVLSALLLALGSPILLLASLLVLFTGGPPVLYRQERVGQFGRRFTMLKLRTMARDAEAQGPEFAAESDRRVLPVGRLLRRLRLDELPQLVNVLRGEMSLVGPRPERPAFVQQLTRQIPYYAFRTAVPPGITGWAQVNTSYARNLADHRKKLEFDLYFIRERSLRLYLLTLLRTTSAALGGVRRDTESSGAAGRAGAQVAVPTSAAPLSTVSKRRVTDASS